MPKGFVLTGEGDRFMAARQLFALAGKPLMLLEQAFIKFYKIQGLELWFCARWAGKRSGYA